MEQYTSSSYPPGTWTVKVKGTALDGSVQEVEFDWILRDPCTPPNSVSIDPITLDDYLIIGEVYQKSYPSFTIDPPHCTAFIEMTLTDTNDQPLADNNVYDIDDNNRVYSLQSNDYT